jgi:dihydrofolate reductase
MAKIVFEMNMSLDGYVDHERFAPDPVLFRYFTDSMGGPSGRLYGRKLYELMSYWDQDHWNKDDPAQRDFAAAWRGRRKWVISRTLTSAGPNVTLIKEDLAAAVRRLKAEHDGEIEVGGPHLAGQLTALGLIDEYRPIIHPVVLGHGRPFFTGPRPPLRLVAHDRIGESVVRLTYVPASSGTALR